MTTITTTSVIVVGGSLVGLSTALFLSHWNVPVILLERHAGSASHPRAIGYTTRTIELLQSVGAKQGIPSVKWTGGPPRRVVVESLAGKWQQEQEWTQKRPSNGNAAPKPGPSDYQRASPVEGLAVAQDKIEPVLRARAVELGADLRLGHTLADWSQDDTGVSVEVVRKDGSGYTIKAHYLVACDGGRSPIREKLGIQRHGVGYVRGLRSILFRCAPLEKYLERGYAQFQIEGREDGFEAFMTTYGDGRWMLAWSEEDASPLISEATQRDWIRKAAGLDVADENITLITTGLWEIGGLIAESFSSGRVFIAGDAAHTLPPNRGGYGANTGIADAHNIAWKLASVVSGNSWPELLETYDAERRPVAQLRHDQLFARDDHKRHTKGTAWAEKDVQILDDVSIEFGQLYRSGGIISADESLPDAQTPWQWKGQPGVRAPHVPLKRGAEGISTLDFFGKDWVVISKDESWAGLTDEAISSTHIACKFVHIGGDVQEENGDEFCQLFGLDSSGATLVRPDGFIAWRASRKPADAKPVLIDALRKASYAAQNL